MTKLTTDEPRRIIEDFAELVKNKTIQAKKPDEWVINFRNEQKEGIQRPIVRVPLDVVRFRKDNGRISSDVMSYEKLRGPLMEDDEEGQIILAGFLEKKDPEKTNDLRLSIQHGGQREPAIITKDGFLVNGNRRKLVLERLAKETGDSEYQFIRVVILPGHDDKGGPPTLREIEELENRYQLQSEGKAEYYGFDRALSIRRKINLGITLAEQLRDDPLYVSLDKKEFEKVEQKYTSEFLLPLECVDHYLEHFKREGLYDTISAGYADREGRWQAFVDYSKFREQLKDDRRRTKLGIADKEVGRIEDVAFKLIRKRELSSSDRGSPTGLPKVHVVMRNLPKLFSSEIAKKELRAINDIPLDVTQSQKHNKEGKEYSPREVDKIWGEQHATVFIRQLKKAYNIVDHEKNAEAHLTVLSSALDKLNDPVLQDLDSIGIGDLEDAERIAREIKDRADFLETEFYHRKKDFRGLPGKKDHEQ